MKYFILLILSGCGVTLHSDPIKVDPIIITATVNLSQVENYCNESCVGSAVANCATNCYTNFINAYAAGTAATPTPTPSGGH